MNYPIGIQDFAKLRENDFVYVDKTDMVFDITKNDGVYFLSRPRRFGKSLLVSTIKYYFEGRHDLFKGLKIESLETKWETYPVFEIDFNGSNYTEADALEQTLNGYLIKWEQQYGVKPATDQPGRRLATCCIKLMYRRVRPAWCSLTNMTNPCLTRWTRD